MRVALTLCRLQCLRKKVVTPVPIPNTEVKPSSAHGAALDDDHLPNPVVVEL
jgi:hypothetical protein